MKPLKSDVLSRSAGIVLSLLALAALHGCWGEAFVRAPVETIETSSKIDSLLKENAVLKERVALIEEALCRAEERDRSANAALKTDLDELKDQLNAVSETLRETQEGKTYRPARQKLSSRDTMQNASEAILGSEESRSDSSTLSRFQSIDSSGAPAEAKENSAHSKKSVPSPEDLHRTIYLAYSRREYENALDESEVFLSEYPDDPLMQEVLYLRAQTLTELGRPEDALKEYSTLLQLFPGGKRAPGALLRMAITYESMGQAELAAGVVRRLIAEYPRSSEARAAEERFSDILEK